VTLALAEINNDALFSHYDFPFVKPLDEELLHSIFEEYENIVTIEDGTIIGGFGTAIAEFKSKYKYKNDVQILGIPDQFIEQGTVEELQRFSKISVENLITVLSTYSK
jgi:1-deoxy-D-xylulose-5-phosphate synthase